MANLTRMHKVIVCFLIALILGCSSDNETTVTNTLVDEQRGNVWNLKLFEDRSYKGIGGQIRFMEDHTYISYISFDEHKVGTAALNVIVLNNLIQAGITVQVIASYRSLKTCITKF